MRSVGSRLNIGLARTPSLTLVPPHMLLGRQVLSSRHPKDLTAAGKKLFSGMSPREWKLTAPRKGKR